LAKKEECKGDQCAEKEFCSEHTTLIQKVAETCGKVEVLVALNVAEVGLIAALIGVIIWIH
jgi:hypothetical protein